MTFFQEEESESSFSFNEVNTSDDDSEGKLPYSREYKTTFIIRRPRIHGAQFKIAKFSKYCRSTNTEVTETCNTAMEWKFCGFSGDNFFYL